MWRNWRKGSGSFRLIYYSQAILCTLWKSRYVSAVSARPHCDLGASARREVGQHLETNRSLAVSGWTQSYETPNYIRHYCTNLRGTNEVGSVRT